MLAVLDSRQLTEIEAYWRVEEDPEGPQARIARIAAAQKAPFNKAMAAANAADAARKAL